MGEMSTDQFYYSGRGLRDQGRERGGIGVSSLPPIFGNSADAINARITRDQFQDYQERFAPIEAEFIGELMDENYVTRGVDNTRDRVKQAHESAIGVSERDISRAGLNVTPRQREAIERLRKLGFAKNMTSGMNTARDVYSDLQMEGMNTMMGYGRGLVRSSAETSGQLAQSAANRTRNNAVARAQHQNQALQLGAFLWALSAREYKENIQTIDTGVLHEEIMKFNIVQFDYKKDAPASGRRVGVITDEIPERYVTEDGKMLNVYNIIHALVASVQVQERRIKDLEQIVGEIHGC